MPPETSLAGLVFLCDAKHSCDNDHLVANYYSVYATDQIDVADKLKVRAGVRKDWLDTSLTPNITVSGRFDTEGQPLVAGVTDSRDDAPVSWNIGVLYKALPWMSPYLGVSKSHLANLNSENTQNGFGAPESALQYDAGIKFSFLDDRYVLNTALFDVERDNVAALTTISNMESVDLNIHNLTDRRYFIAANAAGAYVGESLSACEPPRQFLSLEKCGPDEVAGQSTGLMDVGTATQCVSPVTLTSAAPASLRGIRRIASCTRSRIAPGERSRNPWRRPRHEHRWSLPEESDTPCRGGFAADTAWD